MSYDVLHRLTLAGVVPREPWSTIHLGEFDRAVVVLAGRMHVTDISDTPEGRFNSVAYTLPMRKRVPIPDECLPEWALQASR